MDRGTGAVSLALDGITLEFYLVPAGGTEADAECRTALFFPQYERRHGQDEHGLESLVEVLRTMLRSAYAYGLTEAHEGRLDWYDLSQPQVAVYLLQYTLLTSLPHPIMMCVCNPYEAAMHGGQDGRVFRVYMTQGDAPASWWFYRQRDNGAYTYCLDLIEQIVELPATHSRMQTRPQVAGKTTPARKRKVAIKPRFTEEEQARLDAMHKTYNPDVMAHDGAEE